MPQNGGVILYFIVQEGSQEYTDACDLLDLYNDTKNILLAEVFGDNIVPDTNGDEASKASTPVLEQEVSRNMAI